MDAVEDLWAKSSQSLRAHKDGFLRGSEFLGESLWAHGEGLVRTSETLGEALWAHKEGLLRCSETVSERLRAHKDGLIRSSSGIVGVLSDRFSREQSNAEDLLCNVSALLFERQRLLADALRNSLTLKLKIFIIFFLLFGARGYVNTEATDISLLFLVVSIVAYYVHRVSSASSPPILFYKQSDWMTNILELCPLLQQPYRPTLLWGWNGHIQTFILGKMGRSINPALPLVRRSIKLEDGATVYYDTFEPPFQEVAATVIVAPGIANTSEKLYIKTFARRCLISGFRCVVLNHLGALKDYPLTTPRIFGYGHTAELAAVVDKCHEKYPSSQKILVGFSMGGNMAAKYMCEAPERQKMFAGIITVCQGYDITRSSAYLLSWERLARFYNWAITNGALKSTINRNAKYLYRTKQYDQSKVATASCIQDLDNCLMTKMYKFSTKEEMYTEWSCSRYLDNISIPMMMMNAVDDPVIAPVCSDIPIRLACQNERVLHVQTQCGGHLGFYEGGWLIPNGFSWLDRTLVEFIEGLVALSKDPSMITDSTEE